MRRPIGWIRGGLALLLGLAACGDGHGAERRPAPPQQAAAQASSPTAQRPREPVGPDGRWGHAGGLRYLELLRGGAEPEQRVPMIVMIHGLGDRPTPQHFGPLDVPARVILPQAPTPYGRGFSWFEYRAARADPEALARGISAAADQLAGAIEELTRTRPTAGRPLLTGFSQGGMLSFALAVRRPELFALVHPIAGALPAPLWPDAPAPTMRYPPIHASHGSADRVVPFEATQKMVQALKARGFEITLTEFPGVRHTISRAMGERMNELLSGAAAAQAGME